MADEGGSNVFKDLNMTQDEITRFSEAFKKEEFRQLFKEYVEELQDPEKRALYEKEISQLEEERGMEVEFINPEPGYVLKLPEAATGAKVFVNMCKSDKIQVASVQRGSREGKTGFNWSIPHSFAPPREDLDKGKRTCTVVDVVFHPDTFLMASRNAQFKRMMEETALQGIEKNFDKKLDATKLRRPKLQFKGLPQATVIRRKRQDFEQKQQQLAADPNPFVKYYNDEQTPPKETPPAKEFELSDGQLKEEQKEQVPKHSVKYSHRSDFGHFALDSPGEDASSSSSSSAAAAAVGGQLPTEIVVCVELPGVAAAQAIDVDVSEGRELLVTCERPQRYRLRLRLAYQVDDESGSARFDKKSKILTLTLPVVPPKRISQQANSPQPAAEAIAEVANETEEAAEQKEEEEEQEQQQQERQRPKPGGSRPPVTVSQCRRRLSLRLDVSNVRESSLLVSESAGRLRLSFESVGSGGWGRDFSLGVRTSTTAGLRLLAANASADNVLLLFAKSSADWLPFVVCDDGGEDGDGDGDGGEWLAEAEEDFGERLRRQLAQLDEEASSASGDSATRPELRVTELSDGRLSVSLDGSGRDLRLCEPPKEAEAEEEAAAETETLEALESLEEAAAAAAACCRGDQRLHGILKNGRSGSFSSSDDLSSSLSSCRDHQQQLQQLQQQQQPLGRSVSFSERVESANYQTNASVSEFHHTLRNRKKRQKQRANRRRRHFSDSCGCDREQDGGQQQLQQQQHQQHQQNQQQQQQQLARIRRVSESATADACLAEDEEEIFRQQKQKQRRRRQQQQQQEEEQQKQLEQQQQQEQQQQEQQQEQQQQQPLSSSVIFELDDD